MTTVLIMVEGDAPCAARVDAGDPVTVMPGHFAEVVIAADQIATIREVVPE